METITLKRTGDRALQFTGELIAETSTATNEGPGNSRYWRIGLYATESGKLVLSVGYKTQWQGEQNTNAVYICENSDDLAACLTSHPFLDAATELHGGNDDRYAKRVAVLTRQWEVAVSEILGNVEPEKL